MKLLRRLDIRLLLSYLGVIAVSLLVMTITLQILAPSEFETQVETIGQQYGFGRQFSSDPDTATTDPGATSTVPDNGAGTTTPEPSNPPPPATSTSSTTTPGSGPNNPGSGPGGPDSTGGGAGGPGGPGGSGGTGGQGGSGDASAPVNGAVALNPLAEILAQQGPRGPGGGTDGTATIVVDLENAFDDALNAGLWIALLASLISAMALAAFSSSRILKPLRDVRAAAGRMAEGRYVERIPIPREFELAELATDVNALGETLARTEQQRSRLMSDLAHELRTPLTTIQGYMEGLIDGVFEPTPEVYAEVAEEAMRLKRLTADLSLLSRAEEGALVLDLSSVDLGEVASRAAERLRPQFLDKEVQLSIGPMPELPVNADADRLAQVFTNLVGNALVHTPAGGHVWLTAGSDDKTCNVEVNDTGAGISSEEIEQIFERFHRIEGESVVYAGSGIGLTISRTIIRSHDGDITVSSAGLDRGATFAVRLPRKAD